MKIYNLNKINDEDTRQLVIDQLPKTIVTDVAAHLLKGTEEVTDSPFMRFDNLVFTNVMTISNLRIEEDFIHGDISYGDVKKSYTRSEVPKIDLRENNSYKILFKPSFESIIDDDKNFIPEKFHNFYVYLIEKSKFREERLAKLLEI